MSQTNRQALMAKMEIVHPERDGECVRWGPGWLGAERCSAPTLKGRRLCEFHSTSTIGQAPSVEPDRWVELEIIVFPDDVAGGID